MCLAQGRKAAMPVRLEPPALRSQVKHSNIELLHSRLEVDVNSLTGIGFMKKYVANFSFYSPLLPLTSLRMWPFPAVYKIWDLPGSRGGKRDPHPPEKLQKYRVSSQYWSRSPKNHKAYKPAFSVGPPSASQHNTMLTNKDSIILLNKSLARIHILLLSSIFL